MADDRISSYIDLQAVGKETEEILRQINQVYTSVKEINQLKLNLDRATSVKETARVVEALRQKQAELTQGVKTQAQINILASASQQKLNTDISQAEIALAASKAAMQERNRELKLAAQLENAEAGTLQKLRAELNQLNQFKNTKLKIGTEEYDAAVKKIADLNKQISEQEKLAGDFRRQVGNYAGALFPLFDKLTEQISKLKEEQKGLQDFSKSNPIGFQIGGGQERLNQVTATLEKLEQVQQVGFKTTGNQIQQIQTLENALSSLTTSGTQSTEFVEEFSTALNQVKTSSFSGSAKIIVESMEQARQKVERLNREMGDSHPATQAAKAEYEALQRVTSNPNFLNIAGRVGDATGELRSFTRVLIDLEQRGQGGTDFAQELRQHLAALADQIGDARAEIRALSSDTRNVDLLASGVNTLVSTYQTYIGVAELAGASEEDMQESIQKLVAVQAVANGMREIATELTERGTLANKAYVFVQGLYATATDRSAAATARLGAAMKLAGIGLAVAAIAFLVTKLSELSKVSGEAGQKQKMLGEINERTAESVAKVKAEVQDMRSKIDMAKEGVLKKETVLKEYNETLGKSVGHAKNLNEAEQTLNKNAEAFIQYTWLKAEAQAAYDLALEESQRQIKAQGSNLTEFVSNTDAAGSTLRNVFSFMFGGSKGMVNATVDLTKTATENQQKVINESEVREQRFLSKREEFLAKAAKLKKQYGFTDVTDVTTPKQDYTTELNRRAAEQRKLDMELRKVIIQSAIEEQKIIVANEANTANIRTKTRLNQMELERQLLKEQKEFELNEINITASQEITAATKDIKNKKARQTIIKAIEEKAATDRKILNEKYAQDEIDLNSKTASEIIAIRHSVATAEREQLENASEVITAGIERENKAKIDALTEGLTREVNFIERSKNQKFKALNEEYTAGKISKAQHEEEKEKIEADALKRSLEQQIKYYKALAELYFVDEAARKDALNRIAALEAQLSDIGVRGMDKTAETAKERAAAIKEAFVNLANELKGLTFDLFTAGIDREKNAIQEQINLLEQKKAKEIELVAQSVKNEQDKAAAITVIQARATAQKEQMEMRQRRLDEQRARYERAAAIADIIGNTGQAVTSALASTPPNIPLAIVVGAIGAAQIARVAAQPLPKFAKGKPITDKYEGLAWVGDGGRPETILRENGSVEITPATNTLTWLGKNDVVLPDTSMVNNLDKAVVRGPDIPLKELNAMQNWVTSEKVERIIKEYQLLRAQAQVIDLSEVKMSIHQMRKEVVSAVKNKRELHVKLNSAKEIIFKDGPNRSQYLNNNLQG